MEESSPKTLGRYEIVEELGRGAMGVVYKAQDPIIGRHVALKVLRLPMTTEPEEREQFRRRFIREAQSAGILAHTNIVTIHDVAEGEPDEPTFIAMELIHGTDLKELLRPGKPLDLTFVADVVTQIAQGLDYAHSQSVVHRDIKPANILITPEGRVKITDFGIARIDTSNLTQDTQLLGTPNYMAPEQIQGTDTDHRVDIFALGVLLYEMVTGQKPFQGENVTEVTHRIVYEDHRTASERVPELPDGLDRVLERALAKNPEDRYDQAGELAEDLRRVVRVSTERDDLNATQIVDSDATGGGPRDAEATGALSLERVWQGLRSPRGLALGGALVLLLAITISAAWWLRAGSGEAAVATPPAADPRVERMIREGHQLLADGDPEAALQKFRDVERLAPERAEVRTWRELAERQAETFERLSERQRQLGERLAAGQLALADGRFEDALQETEAVQELADDDPDALAQAEGIRQQAEEGLQRQEEQRQAAARRRAATEARRRQQEAEARKAAEAAEAEASETEADEAVEPAAEAEEPAAPAGEPTLAMRFVSDLPQGTLTIFVGQERFLNQSFKFVERKGFLGLGGGESYRGQLELPPTQVPRGTHTVRVYVTPRGDAAQAAILESVDFAPGDARTLELQLSDTGKLTAEMN
jgi:tRNA A-37 threonylcarbamoyl transferase component Bud32